MRIDFLENEEIIAQLPDIKPLMKLRMISTSLEITVAADVKNESLPQLFTVFCDNAGICKMNREKKMSLRTILKFLFHAYVALHLSFLYLKLGRGHWYLCTLLLEVNTLWEI